MSPQPETKRLAEATRQYQLALEQRRWGYWVGSPSEEDYQALHDCVRERWDVMWFCWLDHENAKESG